MRSLAVVFTALLGFGCAARTPFPLESQTGQFVAVNSVADYRIGPLDVLSVNVFQSEALSASEVQVDAGGQVQLPLIGNVSAGGLTPSELSDQIVALLGERYLQTPRVSVTVKNAASQKVTVDGAVTEPGVYEMQGTTSLLQAVAMAKGPTRTAALERVAVFRVIDGTRMVAVYDLRAIRRGVAEDPQMRGNDVVVIDSSTVSVAFREILTALPGFAIFRPY